MIEDRIIINRKKRADRMRLAKEKGAHTKDQWEKLKIACGGICVFCLGEYELINLEKDHIIPVYQGGSDSIENIQPSCAKCNAAKGSDNTDMRPFLWRDAYALL
jgi:5-methylcytosine-specific restriction endonuclease McrA